MPKTVAPSKWVSWMLALLLFVTILTAVLSCATFLGGPLSSAIIPTASRPPECADSLIWDATGNPAIMGTPLILAVYEYAKCKPEHRPLLYETVTYAQTLFEQPDLTYRDFALLLTKRVGWLNKYLGGEIFILTEMVDVFDQRIPITECDRRLICQHLAKQKRALSLLN